MRRLLCLAVTVSLAVPPAAAERLAVPGGASPDTIAVRHLQPDAPPDPLPSPRWGHGAAVFDGKLYVFGGWDGSAWTADAVRLDPATGRWAPVERMPFVPMAAAAAAEKDRIVLIGGPVQDLSDWRAAPPLAEGRFMPGAVRLKDGRILAAGGFDRTITTLSSVEIFDPVKVRWTTAAPMARSRYIMVFALLPDGRVLAAGGRQNQNNSRPVDIADSEIYDPATDAWTPAGPMREPLDGALTFVRPDGFVLAVGGGYADGIHTNGTELFDPRTGRWSDGPPMKAPRISAAGVTLKDGRFMIAGGVANGPTLSTVEIYDPRADAWTSAAPMHAARYSHTLTLLPDGRVLAAGGTTIDGGPPSAEVYDPIADSWTEAPGLRHSHSGGASVVVGGRVYLLGGSDVSGDGRVVEVFDLATGAWSSGPALSSPRTMHAAQRLPDERVLVFGGGTGGYPEPTVAVSEILPTSRPRGPAQGERPAYAYSPATGRWAPMGTLSRMRMGVSAASANGTIFAFGGVGREGWGASDYDILENGRWRLGGETPRHVSNAAVAVLDGKVYVAGGTSAPRGEPVRRLSDASIFDPTDGSWTALPPMSTPRTGAAAAAVDGRIFVVGGEGSPHGDSLVAVEAYDPSRRVWEKKSSLPRGVRGAAAAVLDGRLYVVGGSPRDNAALSTVQVYDPRTDSWLVADRAAELPRVAVAPPVPVAPVVPRAAPAPPAAPAPRFAAKSPERPHDYALIVGVGYYKSLPAADYAEDDARGVAAAVRALGVPEENTVSLIGAKATLSEVSKYVEEWLPKRASPDSRVYFFYSGHGSPDVKDGSAFLMPWDGDPAFVKSTGFPLRRLYDALGALKAARVVAMIDSCFSGAGGRSVLVAGVRPLVTVKLPEAPSPKITVLAAAEGEEVAGSFPEGGHGLFSYYLIQGLTGAAAPGAAHLTVDELYAFVRKGVILGARRQNREQNPTLRTPNGKIRLY